MYPVSDTLKQLFLDGNKKCCKLTLNNATTVDCVITEADILSDSLTVDRYCSSGNKIEVGSAIAAELTLTLLNNDKKFNDITFEGSEVSLEIGIEGVSDSYIPCGKFTIDEPPRSSLHIKLRALDFMMLFDKKVDANDVQEIDTVENLLVKCCEVCSVELWNKDAIKSLPNYDQTVKVPTADITYRQIIQWIAQLTGTCAFMDWEGKLRLSWFKDSGVVLDPTNRYIGGTLDENNITIKGVCIKTQNTVVTTEDSVNPVVIESNQLLYSDDETYLEAIANNIATAIGTLTYRPFQCNTIPMPFLYPLDIVSYEMKVEEETVVIPTVITNHNFGLNKASALSAVGETATQSGYSSVKGLTKAEIDSAIREAMNGIDAKAEHIHIRYSAYKNGLDASGNASMSDKPDATTEYLGTCATNSTSPPDTPSSYKWVKIRGTDGKTPVKDVDYFDGKDGGTLQVKYKSSSTKPTIFNNYVDDWKDAIPTPSAGQRVYMTQKLSTETNWSTPIQISAEDGTTPTVSIDSNGYWVINGGTTTVKAQGANGKTPTITVGENGNWFVDNVDTGEKAQGEQGKDGANIEYIYYRKTSSGAPTTPTASTTIHTPTSTTYNKWTSSPCGITETYKYEYVSVRTKAAGSSTWGKFSAPVIWSKWGEKGTDGDGVEYKYYLCNDSDKPDYVAGSDKWTDDPTGVSATNMYEYVVQITHYGDGRDDKVSPASLWAKWGETGDDGRGVSKVETEYRLSTSDTSLSNGYTWGTDAPTWQDGLFLWTRLATTYTDGKTEYSDPVVDASWKKTSVVDAASKELNETLANALGLHVTEYKVGTSNIRYYHSNPTLTASKSGDTILVFNATGFGVCKTGWNNGNPSFTYGTTFDGKAIWDILTANTINANLINAGSIKSLSTAKVQTELNLDSGELDFETDTTYIGVKGQQTVLNSLIVPEGIYAGYKNSEDFWVYTPASGLMYHDREYFLAFNAFKYGQSDIEPEDPYFANLSKQQLTIRDILCKNIFVANPSGSSSNKSLNIVENVISMNNTVDTLSEQVNLLSESLTALQDKYLALEVALGQQHEHTPSTAVRENTVPATCTAQGSYDEVVYCATCGDEISRTKKYTNKVDHSYTSAITKQPTCTATGTRKYTCSVCGDSRTETIAVTGHKDTDGNGYCDVCNAKVGDFRTIKVEADPTNGGTVSGGGDYLYGSTATVKVDSVSSGYSFDGWYYNGSKWSSNTSYSFTVNSTRTLTAKFTKNPTSYTISLTATPTGGGYFKIGGVKTNSSSVTEGSTVTIEAIPNDGFTFKKWNDGSTSASKTITVNGAIAYTATFEAVQTEQTITEGVETSVNIPVQNEVVYLKFVPKYSGSYTFVSLDQSSLDPDGYVYLADKQTEKAYDGNRGSFSVSWDGFDAGATYYLGVRLYSGTGTLKVKVTKDAVVQNYTITTAASPSSYGSITGGGTYASGATATLTATPNSGYRFTKWQDGNTDNPRSVTVTGNATYTATFEVVTANTEDTIATGQTKTVTVGNSNASGLSGLSASNFSLLKFTPTVTAEYSFSATGYTGSSSDTCGCLFNSSKSTMLTSNDDIGDSSHFSVRYNCTADTTYYLGVKFLSANTGGTITVKCDTETKYTLTVQASSIEGGTVTGGGTVKAGETCSFSAAAKDGYEFAGWYDGNTLVTTSASSQITMTANKTLTAKFNKILVDGQYVIKIWNGIGTPTPTVKVERNGEDVTISGDWVGEYAFNEGDTFKLTATPATGRSFNYWLFETRGERKSINPYTFTVSASDNGGVIRIYC